MELQMVEIILVIKVKLVDKRKGWSSKLALDLHERDITSEEEWDGDHTEITLMMKENIGRLGR